MSTNSSSTHDSLLTIGTLAARTGVSVSAVRFYEKKGLISSVPTESTHRRFHRSTIRRLSIIIVCQRLGYSLSEIHDRLGVLPTDRIPDQADWTALSTDFRSEIDDRVERLLSLRDHLDGCIGCGCISLDVCMLYNPDDAAADLGAGPRYLMGETSADLPNDSNAGPKAKAASTRSTPTTRASTSNTPIDAMSASAPAGSTAASTTPSTTTSTASSATSANKQEQEFMSDDTIENSKSWHLAQINIGRLNYPVDDPRTAEFMDNLDPINEVAEQSPGFVWRLQDESGNATAIRAFEDETILPNLSVWESAQSLKDFTFKTGHARFLRRRREWFEPMDDLPVLTMWWIPAGHTPTLAEAKERIDHLAEHGPSDYAFTFHPTFDPPPDNP